MGNDKMAIVLMTHRFDMTARHCIETAAGMAGDDVNVFIGDNSCDPEKWAFMREVEQRFPRCNFYPHEHNLGSGGNWVFLMDRQVDEYLCLINDDDVFAPDYFLAGRDALRADRRCAAASGLFLSLGWRQGQLGVEMATPYEEANPVDRIRSYALYHGFNATNYAVHRRADVVRFQDYMRDRPFFPAYMDQFQTITLLVQGTRVVDPHRQLYVYNNSNWVTRESIDRANAGYYVAAGLPDGFKHLHLLCWAADTIHYFNSTYRPEKLSDADAAGVVDVLHDRLVRQLFVPYLLANLPAVTALLAHRPETIKVLQAAVETPANEPARMLEHFVTILRAFDEGLADRYQSFVANSLRPIARTAV
jgi:hypothetical protein